MKKFMSNITRVIRLAINIAPILVSIDALLILCSGIISVFSVKISSLFYSASLESVKNSTLTGFFSVFLLFVFVHFSIEIISTLIDFIDFRVEKKFVNTLSEKLHKKIAKFNALKFEEPSFLEKLQLASDGIYSVDYYFFNFVGLIIKDLPYLLFLTIYLFSLRPILGIIPLIIFIPVIISQILNMNERKKLNDDTVRMKRKISHYEEILCGESYVKDTRAYGVFSYFLRAHSDLFKELQFKQWKTNVRTQTYAALSKLFNLMGYYIVLWLLFDSVILGYVNVGEFAAVFAHIEKINSTMNNIVTNRVATLLSSEYNGIDYFIKVLDENEEEWGNDNCEYINSINVKNISFVYPGRDSEVIKNISLSIQRGDSIALVGENGSGKTTLAKLILGLYHPTRGQILYNGLKSNTYSNASFTKNRSAIFQDFYRYLFSLKKNVIISDLSIPEDIHNIEDAMRKSAFCYNDKRFVNGYDTILSKKFGGTDLSGGEWQRLAVARGLYRDANLVVLDEPTSAIDPIEESRVYDSFRKICAGKTSVLITHRLGAAKLANKIYYLENGEILEQGTHLELLRRNGKYAELYRLQSQWYQ